MEVKEGSVVEIDCIGKLENGMVFTDTKEDGPIKFEVGKYDVIKGFNHAVLGLKAGEKKEFNLDAADAFGEYNDDLLIEVPMDQMPNDIQLGMQLQSEDESGKEVIWIVRDLKNEEGVAVLDSNHILAGQKLSFAVTVKTVD